MALECNEEIEKAKLNRLKVSCLFSKKKYKLKLRQFEEFPKHTHFSCNKI